MAVRIKDYKPNDYWTTAQIELTVFAVAPIPDGFDRKTALQKLTTALAVLYSDTDDQERVTYYVGLDQAQIDFNHSASTVWSTIIAEADAFGVLETLIWIAQSEYPDNPELASAMALWRAVLPNQLEPPYPAQRPEISEKLLAHRQLLKNLTEVFAKLYDDPSSQRRVIADAGLNATLIQLSGSAIVVWYHAFAEADRRGQVDALLDVARREYPGNPELNAVAQAWLARNADGEMEKPPPEPEPQDPNARQQRLIEALANLYLDNASQRRIADDAGLNRAQINFTGSAVSVWSRILNEATKQNKIKSLIEVVKAEYPEYPLPTL